MHVCVQVDLGALKQRDTALGVKGHEPGVPPQVPASHALGPHKIQFPKPNRFQGLPPSKVPISCPKHLSNLPRVPVWGGGTVPSSVANCSGNIFVCSGPANFPGCLTTESIVFLHLEQWGKPFCESTDLVELLTKTKGVF